MIMNRPQCSVLIPSHGAASQLRRVFAALAQQTWKDFDVVLVDNNEAPRLSGLHNELYPFSLHIVHEPVVCLSRARNVAVAHARGEHVAFLDDDTVPEQSWLAELYAGLHQYGASVAGGAIVLGIEGEPPSWFTCDHRRLLAELLYDGNDLPVVHDAQYICGGNMIVSVKAFDAVGGFLESFGRIGSVLRSSEELEWCRRVQSAGMRVSFIASARVTHIIGPDRQTVRYFLKRAYWQGRSDALLEYRHGRPVEFGPRSNWKNVRALGRRAWALLLSENDCARIGQCIALSRELGFLIAYARCRVFWQLRAVRDAG
ncbi:MAG: glycosyltransferase family 2 protein [Acidobacteria bacterium]|nr:glycosyltransferase family 2 protein [Acidobacteriota bacterium]